jgi:hypothetical protein
MEENRGLFGRSMGGQREHGWRFHSSGQDSHCPLPTDGAA